MPYALADIWNEALGHLGVADEIRDPETEASKEATACRRFWPGVRDQVLRDFPWPRLTVTQTLALVATAPNGQWGYSYRMPDKVARLRRVLIAISPRLDSDGTRIPFELGRDDSGELIFSDEADAKIAFTYAEQEVARYTPDIAAAMALLLAAFMAPRFGPEAVKLGDRAMKLYVWRMGTARATALNEEKPDTDAPSGFEVARDG